MAANIHPQFGRGTQIGFLIPALILIFGTFIIGYLTVIADDGIEDVFLYPYLLPWIALTAIILSFPLFILYFYCKRRLLRIKDLSGVFRHF